jgi:hypothetical protein
LAIALACAGCSFQLHAIGADAEVTHDGPGDAPKTIDAAIDAPPPAPYMLACSSSTLYQLDVDAGSATARGPIKSGGTTYSMDSLAGDPTVLYGIPTSVDSILSIDPSTGAVTHIRALSPQLSYYGFTYVPAGDLGSSAHWLAGTGETSGGSLYSIDPAAGTATSIGSFGNGLYVAGDIAWVHGHGLYATMYGPSCSPTCIASIDPSTGAATVLSTSGPNNGLSMSGFRGQLWVLDNAGNVWTVDTTNGNATLAFSTSIVWADAAQ